MTNKEQDTLLRLLLKQPMTTIQLVDQSGLTHARVTIEMMSLAYKLGLVTKTELVWSLTESGRNYTALWVTP